LCGSIGVVGKPLRLRITSAATSAATPAFTCTTAPPAKSLNPLCWSQPPPQTQWATGRYTSTSHNVQNSSIAPNLVLSANAPMINAGVMIANVNWNITNTVSGMGPLSVSSSTPRSHAFDRPPMIPDVPPAENASE
jgi:hypothetical protein